MNLLSWGRAWVVCAAGLLAPWLAQGKSPIFVLNSLDATVSVIDPVSFKEIRRVPTGKEPHHLYLTPPGMPGSLIVANAASDSLTLLDPKTGEVQRTLTGIVDPYHLRFSPDGKWFVTAANRLDHIDIYRVLPGGAKGFELQLVKRIAAPQVPSHIAIDSTSRTVYVTLQESDEVIAIDLLTQTPKWTAKVGRLPADVYITPDDRRLMVAMMGDEYVEVFDLAVAPMKLLTRIRTAPGAHAFRTQGDRRHLFVTNRVHNSISKIDLQSLKVVDTLPGPSGPDCMEVLADGKTLLVTSRWAGKLTVIDIPSRRVVQQVKVGKSPHGVWSPDHVDRQ